MLLPGIPLADLATEEYRARRETARRKLADCAIERPEAEALLRPWLALAIRMGAEPEDLPPGIPALADLRFNLDQLAETPCADGAPPPHTPAKIRALVADGIVPRAGLVATLAAARDAAVSRALADPTNPKRAARAHDLSVLAVAMGLPLFNPAPAPQRELEAA